LQTRVKLQAGVGPKQGRFGALVGEATISVGAGGEVGGIATQPQKSKFFIQLEHPPVFVHFVTFP
jgi:hypothetical protein